MSCLDWKRGIRLDLTRLLVQYTPFVTGVFFALLICVFWWDVYGQGSGSQSQTGFDISVDDLSPSFSGSNETVSWSVLWSPTVGHSLACGWLLSFHSHGTDWSVATLIQDNAVDSWELLIQHPAWVSLGLRDIADESWKVEVIQGETRTRYRIQADDDEWMQRSSISDALLHLRVYFSPELEQQYMRDKSSLLEKIFVHPLSSVQLADGSQHIIGDAPWYMASSQSACSQWNFRVSQVNSWMVVIDFPAPDSRVSSGEIYDPSSIVVYVNDIPYTLGDEFVEYKNGSLFVTPVVSLWSRLRKANIRVVHGVSQYTLLSMRASLGYQYQEPVQVPEDTILWDPFLHLSVPLAPRSCLWLSQQPIDWNSAQGQSLWTQRKCSQHSSLSGDIARSDTAYVVSSWSMWVIAIGGTMGWLLVFILLWYRNKMTKNQRNTTHDMSSQSPRNTKKYLSDSTRERPPSDVKRSPDIVQDIQRKTSDSSDSHSAAWRERIA